MHGIKGSNITLLGDFFRSPQKHEYNYLIFIYASEFGQSYPKLRK